MTAERLHKVKEIFHAALNRPAAERAAFLDAACARDAQLRSSVELMLADEAKDTIGSDNTTVTPFSPNRETESFAGRSFAHYRLEREIGRGGMGRVYLALDTRLKRPVALKLLPPSFSEDAEWIRRFQQEALAVSALNHPNIITIHEIGDSDGLRFIVTEFVDGETLGEIISAGRSDLNKVIRIILQVTEALTAAHKAGIVHRDIKPENIMVRSDGYVKILDFGLAKLSEEPQGSGADSRAAHQVTTTPGMLLGTCRYMSPEQARGHSVDARTDIFSLGVVLYEAVTGQAAFPGETRADVLIAIAGERPPALIDYLPEAPAQLQQIVDQALKKNRAERYQTAEEMRVDLEELRDALGPVSLGNTSPNIGARRTRTAAHRIPAVTEFTRQKTKTTTVARWAAALLVAVVLAFVAYKWWRRSAPPAFENIQVRRLTSIGEARFGAVSPDGKFLGYAVRDENGGSFWLKQLATNTTRVVMPATRAVELWALDFSADSNYFYYLIEEVNNRVGGTLYRVPVLGGSPSKVISGLRAGGFSVSPNDRQILFPRVSVPESNQVELTIVEPAGSHERVVKKLPADDVGPIAWSPDSQGITVAADEHDAEGRYWRLMEIALSDGAEKPLSAKYRTPLPRNIAWLPDRTGVILLAVDEASGVNQVWQLTYPDGQLRRITHDLHDYARLSVTADGKSLVTAQNDRQTAVWVGPIAAPADAAAASHAITSNVSNIGNISSTPEGKIVFSQMTNNAEDIWEMNADGSDARQLTANAGRNSHPTVSADGRYIVFTSTRSGPQQVWRIDRDGGNPVQLTNETFYAAFPHCAPVGNWVVFAARASRTSWGVWNIPLAGGLPLRLGESVETTPAISPDGRQVAYEYLDQTVKRIKLCVQPLEGGPITTIADSDVGYSNIRWTLDGKAIAYVSNSEGRTNIWAQPVAGGSAKKLTDFKTEWLMRFDWSRDGKQLICVRGRLTSDLFMISNNSNSK